MEVAVVGRQAAAAAAAASPEVCHRGRILLGRVSAAPRLRRSGAGGGVLFCSGARRVAFSRRAPLLRLAVRAEVAAGAVEKKGDSGHKAKVANRPQFFVGLPLDAVSEKNTLNHAKAIAAGLKALKLLGADGVELPVFWGVVEKEAMGKYDWSSYLALAQLIKAAGLRIRVSLHFHASATPAIPLPSWVSSVGDAEPDIYFTDKQGRRNTECLSLAVDDLPVLGGKTPMQVYEDFCRSFQAAFSKLIGSTITDITIGMGPGGELRYPSLPCAKKQKIVGVGEFQCYDKHMLDQLKQAADESGNPLWGLSGPHDAPQYDQTPDSGNFFKEHGGSWESAYGDFFLSWYSSQLLAHGDRLLSMASKVFGGSPVTLSGKVPLVHPWYNTRSHPLELTTGYYNTIHRDGYDAVAEMFARNSCLMVVPGMELADEVQPRASRSSPESLLSQIMGVCRKHGVRFSGENTSLTKGFGKIKENVVPAGRSGSAGHAPSVETFTYQRMGASFFSPEHWPQFTEFIRSVSQPELHSDDKVSSEEGGVSLRAGTAAARENREEMQVA